MTTRMHRIWQSLRDDGPGTCAQLGVRLDMDPRNVSHALSDLKRCNAMVQTGKARACAWSVAPTDVYRSPGKGGHPNSRANLTRDHWSKGLAAARAARGIRPKAPQYDSGSLEACWRSVVEAASKTGD